MFTLVQNTKIPNEPILRSNPNKAKPVRPRRLEPISTRRRVGASRRLALQIKRSEYRNVAQFNATTCKRVLMSADVVTNLLQAHPFTEGFWPDHLARLSAMASEVRFHPGELIFREGDHSSFFYLLISGNVALEVLAPARPLRGTT